jgi:P27 family predicted phage terminase small subunit
MSGPPRKPNAIRRGGVVATTKPRPNPTPPECPQYLKPLEAAVWRSVVDELQAMGTAACSDGAIYARYAALTVEWWELHKDIQENGRTQEVFGKEGKLVGRNPRPEVKMRNAVGTELRHIEAELGLTPAARERLTAALREIAEPQGKGRFFGAKVAG